MSKATQADLARRIRTAQPVDKLGRYDGASKVEVKAYVREEVAAIEYEIGRIPALEARIAELEMGVWAKFRRWVGTLIARWYDNKDPVTTTIKQGESPKILTGEQIAAALEKHSARRGRTVGAPPALAAKYGEEEK